MADTSPHAQNPDNAEDDAARALHAVQVALDRRDNGGAADAARVAGDCAAG